MYSVKLFTNFSEIKKQWLAFEKNRLITPFQSSSYQQKFADRFLNLKNIYLLTLFDEGKLLAIGGFLRSNSEISFIGMQKVLGGEDLTDFGDILVDVSRLNKVNIWNEYLKFLKQQKIKKISLDFVRDDSLTYLLLKKPAKEIKANILFTKQTVSPYIQLPNSWGNYLKNLDRVKRKELKRKISRLQNINYEFIIKEKISSFDFTEFIRLHRLSDPSKNKFMSEEMKEFFWDLVNLTIPNWEITLCFLRINGINVAAVLYFTGGQAVFLYNSGYDPRFGFYSVGLIVKAFLIKEVIGKGYKIYDFLRGNERYKYDLGAKDSYLYNITINI